MPFTTYSGCWVATAHALCSCLACPLRLLGDLQVSHLLTGAVNLGSSDEEVAEQHRILEQARKLAMETQSRYVLPIRAAAQTGSAEDEGGASNQQEPI